MSSIGGISGSPESLGERRWGVRRAGEGWSKALLSAIGKTESVVVQLSWLVIRFSIWQTSINIHFQYTIARFGVSLQ